MSKRKKDLGDKEDNLTQIIYDTLNKEDKVAYFLDGDEETPTDLTGWVSTSSTMLDLAVSNRAHSGFPAGRIVELIGKEQAGKSLLAAHVLANTINMNGVAVLIDTEAAVNRDFYTAIGLDMTKLMYVHTPALEDIYDIVLKIIEKVRSTDKDKLVTIVIDSLSGASTKKELEADFSRAGYATDKALINSLAMRKITGLLAKQKILLIVTSQIRDKMNAMPFGQQWETSGGKAVRFHASCRIFLQPAGTIKQGDRQVGIKVKAKVIKNRFGPPQREAEFDILFDRGIDDYSAWLKILKESKIIKQAGAWYSYVDDNKNEWKFQSKDFESFLMEDSDRRENLYHQICDYYIMSYKSTDPENRTFDMTDVMGVEIEDV